MAERGAIDSMFDFVEGAFDSAEKALGVAPVGSSAPSRPIVGEIKAGTPRDRFALVEATDSETGEESYIVANAADDRAVCNSRAFAERVRAALERAQ